jgi:hypothetical protein
MAPVLIASFKRQFGILTDTAQVNGLSRLEILTDEDIGDLAGMICYLSRRLVLKKIIRRRILKTAMAWYGPIKNYSHAIRQTFATQKQTTLPLKALDQGSIVRPSMGLILSRIRF